MYPPKGRSKGRFRMLGAVAALAVWLGAAGPLMAQVGGTVRGTVTDAATLRGLANARVILVSEGFVQEETRTNADGVYVMRGVPAGQYSLQFTLIGYSRMEQPVTVTVGQETVLDVAATQAAIQLDALVVTGTAGRTERREIGNAVTSIDVTDLTEVSPIANIQELLNARSPGLTMYKRSGLTGTSSNVQIRGAGSLNASYAPVYYIDGIRFDGNPRPPLNDNLSNATVQFRSPLEFIDPADIERIEVIKGPAASTLYGADAAGGVIQIITKKGTRGADRVQWSASFELTQSEWVKETPTTYKECTPSRQTSSSYPGCVDPSSVVWEGPDGPVTGIPEQDILRDDAWGGSFVLTDNPLQRHPRALREANGYDVKLSARGGGQLFNYYMSFNRMDEEGVFFNNFQDRTGGRANFEWTPTGTLSLGLNMGYTRYHAALPLSDNASSGLLRNAYRGEARARVRDDSDETPGFRGASPDKSNSYDYQMREERTTLGLTANFNPWPWFENRFVVGLDKYDVRETQFYQVDSLCWWGEPECGGQITQRLPLTHTWTADYSGSIRFRLSPALTSRFSGGMQLNSRQYRRFTTTGTGLVASNINLVGSASTTEASEGFEEQTSLGFFVQEQIGWRDKLYGTVALRIDDNSAFGSDFSLVAYPKFSLSYIISEEDFFNLGFVNDLKLRFAWGQAGNAPAPFTADRTYQQEKATVDGDASGGLVTSEFGNPDLKAETGSEWEAGFDASLFGGLLGLEATYYNQRTNDALMSIPDAPSTGFNGTHLVNIGTVQNVGFEMLATISPVRSPNLSWDMTLTFATNKNELESFGGTRDEVQFGAFTNSQRHREGYPLGGFWSVDARRDASGNIIFPIDLTDTCVWPDSEDPDGRGGSCEEAYVGPPTPTRELGLASTFTLFGNLRVFAHLDYKGGHYQLCAICSINNRSEENTWMRNDPLRSDTSDAYWESRQTVEYIQQADFLKLREVALSYTLPASWGGPFGAGRWTINLAARNLWTATKYDGPGDPEVLWAPRGGGESGRNSNFETLDYASVPPPRRISASISVNF